MNVIMIGSIPVEIRPATAPDGRPSVLIQVGDDWYLGMQPDSARHLARMIIETADEIEAQP